MIKASRQIFWIDKGIKLPSGFKNIDGLETNTYNSGPWIDTGLKLIGKNSKIEGYAILKNDSGSWNCILGAESYDNSSDTIKIRRWERSCICCNHNDGIYFEPGFNQWFYFCVDGYKFKVNDNEADLTWASEVKSPSIIIGGQRNDGSIWSDRLWVGTPGLIRFYENGELVGQFVPAKKIIDNICGFYDTVTNRFLPSASTIAFKEHINE